MLDLEKAVMKLIAHGVIVIFEGENNYTFIGNVEKVKDIISNYEARGTVYRFLQYHACRYDDIRKIHV